MPSSSALRFLTTPPLGEPVRLEWRKAKPGWELFNGAELIGSCTREPDRQYHVRVNGLDHAELELGSDPRVVMRKAAAAIDALSPKIFQGAPVTACIIEADGSVETLFPPLDEELSACRKVFDA